MRSIKDDPTDIYASLQPLILEARATGKWLWCCYYQDLWFSPDELEAQNKLGGFLWGPENWRLRDPREHQAELDKAVTDAVNAARAFRLKWSGL